MGGWRGKGRRSGSNLDNGVCEELSEAGIQLGHSKANHSDTSYGSCVSVSHAVSTRQHLNCIQYYICNCVYATISFSFHTPFSHIITQFDSLSFSTEVHSVTSLNATQFITFVFGSGNDAVVYFRVSGNCAETLETFEATYLAGQGKPG